MWNAPFSGKGVYFWARGNTHNILTPYSLNLKQVRDIIYKNLPILTSNESLRCAMEQGMRVVSRKNKTLGDVLAPSLYSSNPRHKRWLDTRGFFGCGGSRCNAQYSLWHYINCKRKMVAYCLICTFPKLYVGQTTQELGKRVQKHMSSIGMFLSEGEIPFLHYYGLS